MPNNHSQTRVPVPTLERLATYLTALSELHVRGITTISSTDMEDRTGINAAQFRKDLSYFGEFGRPGIGYDVEELRTRIAHILKLENTQKVILVGAGNLGAALVGYPGLRAQKFHIVGVFDNNYSKIGRQLWDMTIQDVADLKESNKSLGAGIGIIAVPAADAQDVANQMIEADIKAILNFAPTPLKLPKHIAIRNVDFVLELAVLSFYVSEQSLQ